MGFIEKKDPVVLNIKLTSKGRELLSTGALTFSYFAIGDSEINYRFNNNEQFNSFNSSILRPADKNPQQLSFITQDLSGDTFNQIGNVPSIPTIIQNNVASVGFFDTTLTNFLTDSNHIKQPDIMINISQISGGKQLSLYQSPSYISNINEPSVGDYLLIKWIAPNSTVTSTTGYTINKNNPSPILVYKIQDIISGSLYNNNLIIEVDRDLPNFSGITGSTKYGGAFVLYNNIQYSGDTTYSTDNLNSAVLTFLQNSQCSTVAYPFWNLSIVFTENIAGVQSTNKQIGTYNTASFAGFVSYIQNQAPIYKKLGIIHYTNSSINNIYGESFYGSPLNSTDIVPTLDVPTIMWHKSSGTTMGVKLSAIGDIKYLTGTTKSLDTPYYDLADENNNIVGKVFYDLKLFVIEDQELLFAMSYKSNRSWTLPDFTVNINSSVLDCPACSVTYQVSFTSPTTSGGTDGTLTVYNILNNIGDVNNNQILLQVYSGSTSGTQIYFQAISGNTIITNLSAGNYVVSLYDLGVPNCVVTKNITIT